VYATSLFRISKKELFTILARNRKSDSGSAARLFVSFPLTEDNKRIWYGSKADSHDRAGSSHPTVKPVELMQWLVRLITPKAGVCLDPFAGTGTTAEACFREEMQCILIEREVYYVADIKRPQMNALVRALRREVS
jgi:DNA modification methylase